MQRALPARVMSPAPALPSESRSSTNSQQGARKVYFLRTLNLTLLANVPSMVSHQKKPRAVGKGSHSLLKGPKPTSIKHSKPGKLPSVKNKIRGVQRLLRKADADHKMKRSLENKLAELQSSLVRHDKEALERRYAVRYHKIRFFERVKLERRVKQLDGKAERGHALSAEEVQSLQQTKQDLQYVIHFPKGERYVSILKQAADPAAQAQLESERTRLMALVRHQLAERALLADADEGLGKSLHNEDRPAEQANADAFFLESDDSDAAQAPATVQPAVAALPEKVQTVPAASISKTRQAQQQSAPADAAQKHQQKRQHHQLQQPKAVAKRPKHRRFPGASADPAFVDVTAFGTRQNLPQPLSSPQTDKLDVDSNQEFDQGLGNADSQPKHRPPVIQPIPKTDVPAADVAVPQAAAAVLKGSSRASSGHRKSQALLHQLKRKHLLGQHSQAKQQRLLPANLQDQDPSHSHQFTPVVQSQNGSAAVKASKPVRTRAEGGRRRRK